MSQKTFVWAANAELIKLGSLLMFRKAIENYIEFTHNHEPNLNFSKNEQFSEAEIKLIGEVFEDTSFKLKFSLEADSDIVNPLLGNLNYYSTWYGIDYQISQGKGQQALHWNRKNLFNYQNFISCHLRIKYSDESPQIYHSRIENWFEFFKYKKEQKFLLLGDDPYPDKILSLTNVVSARNEKIKLNHQLSLIENTKGFIGCASGFAAAAMLSTKPLFVFKHPDHHPWEFITPKFLNQNQKQVRKVDTLPNIIKGANLWMI